VQLAFTSIRFELLWANEHGQARVN